MKSFCIKSIIFFTKRRDNKINDNEKLKTFMSLREEHQVKLKCLSGYQKLKKINFPFVTSSVLLYGMFISSLIILKRSDYHKNVIAKFEVLHSVNFIKKIKRSTVMYLGEVKRRHHINGENGVSMIDTP